MWYIVRLDSSRVATLVKVRSATLVSSDDPTRVKSNYVPVKTTILRQIERCHGVDRGGERSDHSGELHRFHRVISPIIEMIKLQLFYKVQLGRTCVVFSDE